MNGRGTRAETVEERREAVLRAIAYAEDNVREPITVAAMATAAGYSVFHFCRVFNDLVGQTPYDYVMRRRLSAAALELLDTGLRAIDVGMEFQFGSAEAFGRAFARAHGMSPSEWRVRGRADAPTIVGPIRPEGLLMERLNNRLDRSVAGTGAGVSDTPRDPPAGVQARSLSEGHGSTQHTLATTH